MLYLLSPAKSLDYESAVSPAVEALATTPQFIPDAEALVGLLRSKSAEEIGRMMDISEALSQLNAERFQAWRPVFTPENSKPAVLAFDGDVYEGLDAKSLSLNQLRWAQEHVLILSGLYGLLRPLDRLQAYRLEMGTSLANARGRNLYAWWGDRIAEHLNSRAAASKVPVIVNLASQEYFKAADRKCLQPRVVECQFEDWKTDRYKIISFFAKRARGLMARFCIEQGVDRPEGLKDFRQDGYAFVPEASSAERLMFRRRMD